MEMQKRSVETPRCLSVFFRHAMICLDRKAKSPLPSLSIQIRSIIAIADRIPQISFTHLFYILQGLDCSDARDKIYAILVEFSC
jgi:hypothetical protein